VAATAGRGTLRDHPRDRPHQRGQFSCIALAKNPEAHDRTKHIDIQFHFLRRHVLLRRVRLVQCPTAEMVADVLTKAVGGPKHKWCAEAMGLRDAAGEEDSPEQAYGHA
jgi:hypothetical protein